MSQAIKARILKQVRAQIASGEAVYICLALEAIAAQDHRRNIQALCNEIKAEVLDEIYPYKSFGDRALARSNSAARTLADIQAQRLSWLDRRITACKEPAC